MPKMRAKRFSAGREYALRRPTSAPGDRRPPRRGRRAGPGTRGRTRTARPPPAPWWSPPPCRGGAPQVGEGVERHQADVEAAEQQDQHPGADLPHPQPGILVRALLALPRLPAAPERASSFARRFSGGARACARESCAPRPRHAGRTAAITMNTIGCAMYRPSRNSARPVEPCGPNSSEPTSKMWNQMNIVSSSPVPPLTISHSSSRRAAARPTGRGDVLAGDALGVEDVKWLSHRAPQLSRAESTVGAAPHRVLWIAAGVGFPATVYTYALITAPWDFRVHGGQSDGSAFLPGTVRHRRRGSSPQPAPGRALRACAAWDRGSAISASGALIAMSGVKTGRSPTDKRIIDDPNVAEDVWWGKVNMKLDQKAFEINRTQAVDFLGTRDRLYVVDAYAGWDPKYRIKVRVICARPYHALFMHNMLIRPTPEQLAEFGEPDYVIFNAGSFPANPTRPGHDLGHQHQPAVRAPRDGDPRHRVRRRDEEGRVHHHELPHAKQGVLSMHCSATEGAGRRHVDPVRPVRHRQDHAVGRPEAPPDRRRRALLERRGHLQHRGRLLRQGHRPVRGAEPDIYRALRFGSVLENVVYDPETREVDYEPTPRSPRTRAAPTRSSTSRTSSSPASAGIRRTSSS
jgi:hypothetical protein